MYLVFNLLFSCVAIPQIYYIVYFNNICVGGCIFLSILTGCLTITSCLNTLSKMGILWCPNMKTNSCIGGARHNALFLNLILWVMRLSGCCLILNSLSIYFNLNSICFDSCSYVVVVISSLIFNLSFHH